MAYVVKSSERLRPSGADTETKALLQTACLFRCRQLAYLTGRCQSCIFHLCLKMDRVVIKKMN